MMKRFAFAAILLLAAALCFAQNAADSAKAELEKFDVEITAGFPVHWTSSGAKHEPLADRGVSANTALGLSMIYNFNGKIGIMLDTDISYGGNVFGVATNDSDSSSILGANVLLGPVLYLYRNDQLRIPLGLGVHLYYWSQDQWMYENTMIADGDWRKLRDLQLGPGAYLGVQFHFNNKIYITIRTNVALDMFRWHQTKGKANNQKVENAEIEFANGWQVKPAIGVGIKF